MVEYLEPACDVNTPDFVSVYDELPLWSARFGLLLLEHVPLRPNLKLLDVGCGTGFPLLELAQRLGPTCRACGIDPWSPAVARARRKIHVLKIPNVEVIEGDAAAMPFEAEEFNLIVSNLGVNNFADPKVALAECRRVAKPQAVIALTTNLRGHMEEFYDVFRATLAERGNATLRDRLEAHIDHRATVPGTSAMLQQAGFRIRRVREERFSLRFLDGSAMLRHAFIKVGFLDAWRALLPAEEQAELFGKLEADLNRLAGEKGGLEVTIPMAYVEGEKSR